MERKRLFFIAKTMDETAMVATTNAAPPPAPIEARRGGKRELLIAEEFDSKSEGIQEQHNNNLVKPTTAATINQSKWSIWVNQSSPIKQGRPPK